MYILQQGYTEDTFKEHVTALRPKKKKTNKKTLQQHLQRVTAHISDLPPGPPSVADPPTHEVTDDERWKSSRCPGPAST